MKEVSYIHAEGYATGELKHGPFALLDKRTPVIAVVSQDEVYSSILNDIKEIKARQSPMIAVADEEDESINLWLTWLLRFPTFPIYFLRLSVQLLCSFWHIMLQNTKDVS
jgi:glucosamine--fructose-6-phosphate aminotransferase (isomerizing)